MDHDPALQRFKVARNDRLNGIPTQRDGVGLTKMILQSETSIQLLNGRSGKVDTLGLDLLDLFVASEITSNKNGGVLRIPENGPAIVHPMPIHFFEQYSS